MCGEFSRNLSFKVGKSGNFNKMKCIAVLVICCGIALAYDAASECDDATKVITKVVQLTKINAAGWVLWQARKTMQAIESQREELNEYRALNKNAIEPAVFRVPQLANTCMRIFDDFVRESEGRAVTFTVTKSSFDALTSTNGMVELAGTGLINAISYTYQNERRAVIYITQASMVMRAHFTNITQRFITGYVYDEAFKEKIIETIDKLNASLADVGETLEGSPFGKSLGPFVKEYMRILSPLKAFILKRNNDKSLALRKTAIWYVINHFYDMFEMENFSNVILFVASVMKNSNADDIAKMAPPEESLKQTCESMQTIVYSKLTSVLMLINQEAPEDRNSFQIFLQNFNTKILPMEPISIILEKQLIVILQATGISKDDADAYDEFIASGKIDLAFIKRNLEQNEAAYNIRDYYNAASEQIDERILKDGTGLTITRRIWNGLTSDLFRVLNNKWLHPIMVDHLSVIEQKLQIWYTTISLVKTRPTNLMVKFEEMKRFEDAITTFRAALDAVVPEDDTDESVVESVTESVVESIAEYDDDILNKHFDEEKQAADKAAQTVFIEIQLMLYQLNAAAKSNLISEVDEAIKKIGGHLILKESESRVNFKGPFAAFVETFEQLATYFQRLVDLHTELSNEAEKNRMKLAIIRCITDKLNVALDFVVGCNILEYFTELIGQSTNDVGDIKIIDQNAITKACELIKSNFDVLKSVIEQLEEMRTIDDLTPTDIVKMTEEILNLIWKLHCVGLRDRIIQIYRTLPLPLAHQTELRVACNKIRALCWFEKITDDEFEGKAESPHMIREEMRSEQLLEQELDFELPLEEEEVVLAVEVEKEEERGAGKQDVGKGKGKRQHEEVDEDGEEKVEADKRNSKRSKTERFSSTDQWLKSVEESEQVPNPSESKAEQPPDVWDGVRNVAPSP